MTTGQHHVESSAVTIYRRVESIDWTSILAGLDDVGVAASGPVLTPVECDEVVDLQDIDDRFRSTIDMGRHRFGRGQYRYFADSLPAKINELRNAFWPRPLPIARE